MPETKLLGEGTELDVDRIAISGTFERVGEAAQIGGREQLGVAVPGADLASKERHTDVSVDADGTVLLKLDPRCFGGSRRISISASADRMSRNCPSGRAAVSGT